MVNVMLVDYEGGYYFRPMELRLKNIADKRGITLSLRCYTTLDEARQSISWPEVAFVDGDMGATIYSGNKNGYEFIKDIKEQSPDTVAVLFTGADRDFVPHDCPFDRFLSKPADEERMIDIIEEYHQNRQRAASGKEAAKSGE